MSEPERQRDSSAPTLRMDGLLPTHEKSSAKEGTLSVRLSYGLVLGLMVVCGWISLGVEPPLWLQPTLVGVLWGGMVLAGYSLAMAGPLGMPGKVFVVGLTIWLYTSCLQITHLSPADCLLLTTLLFGSGWLKHRFMDQRPGFAKRKSSVVQGGGMQWSIADVATITALSACLVQAFIDLRPTPLLFSISWAFLVGLLYSCIAYRWVWLDEWSHGSFIVSVVGVVAAVSCVAQYAPTDFSWWDSFAWLCAGPVNVVAGQAVTVLLYFASLRFDCDGWQPGQLAKRTAG